MPIYTGTVGKYSGPSQLSERILQRLKNPRPILDSIFLLGLPNRLADDIARYGHLGIARGFIERIGMQFGSKIGQGAARRLLLAAPKWHLLFERNLRLYSQPRSE